VIGAGHNGLMAAALSGAGGNSALVLERRDIVGGCRVPEEIGPGLPHCHNILYLPAC
jgi:phytoene dehydrogenase-like protein